MHGSGRKLAKTRNSAQAKIERLQITRELVKRFVSLTSHYEEHNETLGKIDLLREKNPETIRKLQKLQVSCNYYAESELSHSMALKTL